MKLKKFDNPFSLYLDCRTENELALLKEFFTDFDAHCLLSNSKKKKLRKDFEQAILYYNAIGVKLEKALQLLDVENLGGFYARPAVLWFPLDAAAKIYPVSMKHGRMSVFRIAVYLKHDVSPQLLQMALNFVIKRFPSFATTIKKGLFWHYLDTTKRRFCIQEENDVPCQPIKVSGSGSQSFRVLYYKNRISIEVFHVLTDGSGGINFFKALIAEYLRLCGHDVVPDDTLWDVNATPSHEEFENAFVKVPKAKEAKGFVDKKAVQMNGTLQDGSMCRLLHFRMNSEELKQIAKKHNTSITTYILAVMFLASKAATDEIDGDISIQVPVNMRKYYPSKTVRNFSMYCGIRLPITQVNAIDEIIQAITPQIVEKTSKENMNKMLTSTVNIVNSLRFIPLVIKQPIASVVYGLLGDKIFTNTLSNMGVIDMPEKMLEHIENMDCVLGTIVTNRAGCGLVTIGNTATLSITKKTTDPSFEEKMYNLLTSDGLNVEVEGSEYYES